MIFSKLIPGLESMIFLITCSAPAFVIPKPIARHSQRPYPSCFGPVKIMANPLPSCLIYPSIPPPLCLSADFFPIPLIPINCAQCCPEQSLLLSLSGFIPDSIILAVAAPTPETLISSKNISFSAGSAKPYKVCPLSVICRYVCSWPLSRLLIAE